MVALQDCDLFSVPYVARSGGRIRQLVLEAPDAATAKLSAQAQLGPVSEIAVGRPQRLEAETNTRRASLRWLPYGVAPRAGVKAR